MQLVLRGSAKARPELGSTLRTPRCPLGHQLPSAARLRRAELPPRGGTGRSDWVTLWWEGLSAADEPDQSLKPPASSRLRLLRTGRTSAGLGQLCQESSFL